MITNLFRANVCVFASVVAIFLFFLMVGGSGCREQNWDSNPDHALRFSADTLFFDTVFATVGSITLPLTVYNDHEGTLWIDEVELTSGLASQFRLNVDGEPAENLAIPIRRKAIQGGDSMFVFVEVTVNPLEDAGASPFWVVEDLRFLTNGNEQVVKLIARGQNAVFHGDPNTLAELVCDEVWTAELPHVIYGRLFVADSCTLTIEPGAQIYSHAKSGLWVRGTLLAEGTFDEPIVFRGDRLDDGFQDEPGQWGIEVELTDQFSGNLVNYSVFRGGIWLDQAKDCEFNHVEIKDATIGLWVDTIGTGASHSVRIRNSIIRNAESIGLLSQGGHILGYNNLIANCGQACGYFALGGDIQLHLTTFANYRSTGAGLRQFPTLYLNDWYEAYNGTIQVRPFTDQTEFRNCIAYGNNAGINDFNELVVDVWDPGLYPSPLITASAVHQQQEDFPLALLDDQTTTESEPPFANVLTGDFRITGTSSIWNGISSIPPFTAFEVGVDLEGQSRNTTAPTKGCFERIP